MKALLLIGGLATRLRPLSLNKPKCLFPLINKPIIDYLLENLAKAGCSEAILAVNNLAEKIQEYLGFEKFGIKLTYSYEEEPLGTGGPIKLAEKILSGENFLVLNGDILSFIDYKELMYIHRKNNTIATITLKEVKDPTRYGVVRFGPEYTITEFVEKPSLDMAPSKWINAGCYAFSPKILKYIKNNEKVSIEREVFPKIAEEKQLKGYKYYGEWIDIGLPEDYLKANKMLQTHKHEKTSSISHKVKIGTGCKILDSIIWENTKIGDNSEIAESIIGSYCLVGSNVKINNAVIGDNVIIEDNIKITQGVKIWPENHIKKDIKNQNIEIK